ncbi:hypothetical protein GCM10011348_04840 [Marinobacterium nitratireducens]|uniref:Uncharacterized protein n=1 Tax=Marinobacterium nitratireducens TaxID=518897 RepID=A0A917Z9B3_9GAMM|nr:hypothetical protein [Marinobacterium nitratireducens]GGO76793.1 hypothetical protein GCM10011348_04840 [Marinobacterium nitratireducens]
MGRIKAELRVYATAEGQYATMRYVTLRNFDLYTGSRFASPLDDNKVFRTSYHASGKNHLHIPVPPWRSIGEPGDRPSELLGKRHIAGGGGDLRMLHWSHKPPKQDTPKRKSLILDITKIPAQRCNPEVWIVEPNRPELVQEIHDWYNDKGGEIVAMLHADWCKPEIVIAV